MSGVAPDAPRPWQFAFVSRRLGPHKERLNKTPAVGSAATSGFVTRNNGFFRSQHERSCFAYLENESPANRQPATQAILNEVKRALAYFFADCFALTLTSLIRAFTFCATDLGRGA